MIRILVLVLRDREDGVCVLDYDCEHPSQLGWGVRGQQCLRGEGSQQVMAGVGEASVGKLPNAANQHPRVARKVRQQYQGQKYSSIFFCILYKIINALIFKLPYIF